ncbi:MAG: Zn-ribbon domain-containing OB-fold protein [Candidatus Bathyarchaeia archaeon]
MMLSEKEAQITSKPITYVHKIPIGKTKIFWEKLKEGKIYATKCKKCGSLYYPPQVDCPRCLISEIEWIKLSEEAVLETYTHVYAKPQGFTQYAPYIIAIAKTLEGVKVMGWLEEINPTEIKAGIKLKIITKTISEEHITIVFKPAKF